MLSGFKHSYPKSPQSLRLGVNVQDSEQFIAWLDHRKMSSLWNIFPKTSSMKSPITGQGRLTKVKEN
jgi:hypothetical protein